eukprot:scaffold7428_cov153-Amphora_coffeaeformis.AAC.15
MIQHRYAWLVLVSFLLQTALVTSFVSQAATTTRFSRPSFAKRPTELHLRRLLSKVFRRNKSKSTHDDVSEKIVHAALLGRRTVNNFETTPVPMAAVERAIEAAIHAPCHKMTEPWRFIHLGQGTISKIAALNAAEIALKDPVKGAKKQKRWEAIPGWCVVTAAKSDGGLQEREDYAATCCAAQNFMLSLHMQGVGTKWTTGPITRTDEFVKLCGIDPETEQVVGCLWYGYASDGLETVPTPKRKRGVADVSSTRP